MKYKTFALFFANQFIGILSVVGKRCSSAKHSAKHNFVPGNEYSCPRENEPMSFTECCDDAGCCERQNFFLQMNEELVMIIGVTVITICVVLMTVTIICCFWSKCPCYTTCRANYTSSENIIYSLSKDDPLIFMPNECDGSQYTPCLVKIKKVEEY